MPNSPATSKNGRTATVPRGTNSSSRSSTMARPTTRTSWAPSAICLSFCREKKSTVLGVYDVGGLELVKKYSSINVDGEGRITRFEEKPQNPTSTLIGIALYFYPRDVLPLIARYVAEGNNPDQ